MNNNQLNQERINKLLSEIIDSNIDIQESAIYELGELKIESVVPNLVSLLNNEDTNLDVRWLIVESLGKINSPNTVEPLMSCLSNKAENLNVRQAAIKGLSQHISSSKILLSLLQFADNEKQDIFLREKVKYSIANNLKQTIETKNKDLQEIKDWLETLFTKDSVTTEKILVSNTRSYSTKSSNFTNYVNRAKSLNLNNQELVLIIDCEIKDDKSIILFLEVLPQPNKGITILPSGLRVTFLSPSEKVLKEAKAKEADNRIVLPIPLKIKQLQISLAANKPFKIKVSVENDSYTELFPLG
ncbi:hypothetical protein Xen7305DRAFT_00040170 [Xenococcus sp. PCC 7305]|uniref:HEAT repeat domain-containing protein n=1 Tax=Xenococcus sp. PCC 7305 TaxID=102125 RepID=UPI0002ABD8DE|nr:HEAT repeat domain-containing protein [Xenococcus sp. PCC 7305]ELS04288.1 hypothetical protein Xen7305DRAFT_00040170 [Xenococcus sp. PCC 7305]